MSKPRTKKRARLPDWEARLYTFLNEARNKDLEWGKFDCVIGLANGAVEAQTGVDLARGHRGKYKTERSALKFLKANGWDGASLSEALEGVLNTFLQRAPKGDRHRGNIILLETEAGVALGVRVGRECLAFAPEGGLRLFKVPKGALEWTVI